MPAHSDIDKRMKHNYEHPYRFYLTKRTPVIIRIDGKAFHTFAKNFDKPFDNVLIKSMQSTMKFLCENVSGTQIAYCQSDEISLLVLDYMNFEYSAYFDYNVQKLASICASMATLEFNRSFAEYIIEDDKGLDTDVTKAHGNAYKIGAMFDARCFNIPRDEVTNYFYSRQIDASRNSVEMVGRAYFEQSDLQNKNVSQIQDMLFNTYGVNWNNYPTEQKRGSCCIRESYNVYDDGVFDTENGPEYMTRLVKRHRWIIDHDIPLFKGDGREYIEKYVDIDKK